MTQSSFEQNASCAFLSAKQPAESRPIDLDAPSGLVTLYCESDQQRAAAQDMSPKCTEKILALRGNTHQRPVVLRVERANSTVRRDAGVARGVQDIARALRGRGGDEGEGGQHGGPGERGARRLEAANGSRSR